jgi:putative DNA primase/helicase
MTVAAGLKELAAPGMIDHLAQAAIFQHWNMRTKKMVPCNPPALAASVILSRSGQWTLPSVAAVITTPTLRPDGSLLTAPGYDPATRFYHVPDPALRLPDMTRRPTRADAVQAIELLANILDEFGFVAAVDRSVALSALMTPVLRGMIPAAPLHGIRASTAGSGKTFLVDLASAIATARPCPVLAAGEKDEETEKRLVGALLAAYPIVSIDNCNGELGGDLLNQAIEHPLVRLRVLGDSDIVEIESRATFFATGNGLRVRGDMTRRTIICSLDAGVERPELREFKQDPLQRILADRGAYVAAVLTIIRAYLAAGQPGRIKPTVASFPDWSNTVRSALVWLKQPDPVETMEKAREDDPELTELRQVIGAWHHHFGDAPSTARSVADHAFGSDLEPGHTGLRDALMAVAGERGGINTKRFGKWLLKHEGRIVRVKKDDQTPAKELRFKRHGLITGIVCWKVV